MYSLNDYEHITQYYLTLQGSMDCQNTIGNNKFQVGQEKAVVPSFPTKEEILALEGKQKGKTLIISLMEPFFDEKYMIPENREQFESLFFAYFGRQDFITIDEAKQEKIISLKKWLYATAHSKSDFNTIFTSSFSFEKSFRKDEMPNLSFVQRLFQANQYREVVNSVKRVFTPLNLCSENRELFKMLFYSYHSTWKRLKDRNQERFINQIAALRYYLVNSSMDETEQEQLQTTYFPFEENEKTRQAFNRISSKS